MTAKSTSKSTSAMVTAFGVATATMYISPSAEATIIDLTPNFPQSNTFSTGFGNGASIEIGIGAATVSDFFQFNDGIGKTFYAQSGNDIQGFTLANASAVITAGAVFTGYLNISASASGTGFVAFLTQDNNVGWLQLDFGGSGGDITYLAAAFEDSGNPIHVGSFDPVEMSEPSAAGLAALGLLAAGAAGKRRKTRALRTAAAAK